MKQDIQSLAAISRKKTRLIIGLMSGTSLDGLDVALCAFSGAGRKTQVTVREFITVPYDVAFKQHIRQVFAQKTIDFQQLVLLNVIVAERHAAIVNQCLRQWKVPASDIDLLASHGQTVYHAPRIFHGLLDAPNATLQIGDGDHLARRTKIITLSDFRQKHLAAGGEGAPLALYGDYFLFSKPGEDRFLLNIGGIANFTFLPGNGDAAQAFATDTGPGNTLLDVFTQHYFNRPYDENGQLAAAGTVDVDLLNQLKSDPYFARPFPKTAGPESFSRAWVQQAMPVPVDPHDLLATLTRLTADTIVEAVQKVAGTVRKKALYISGGGAHNPLIVKYLQQNLPEFSTCPMDILGVHGDAKEAVLFAVLANETVAGTMQGPTELGGIPLVSMGKISLPN